MTNKNLILAKMTEKGIRREDAAERLGISLNAFNMKLSNETEFKASEIQALSRMLGISRQKDKYFFADLVD